MAKGWTNISVKDDLVHRIDDFLKKDSLGYTSRGDVMATALRQFLDRQERQALTRDELRTALLAVASLDPVDVRAFVEALATELVHHEPKKKPR